jgi:hypothetical protein
MDQIGTNETYTSALATPLPIGRDAEIAQIRACIESSTQNTIFYITGRGGIGKTFLSNHILNLYQTSPSICAAICLVDLYHTQEHTEMRMAKHIRDSLHRDGVKFENFDKEYHNWISIIQWQPENSVELASQRENTLQALITDLKSISKERRILIAFDTAEYLFFEKNPDVDWLDLPREQSPIQNWLVDKFLPQIQNAAILIAGRPCPAEFLEDLRHIPGWEAAVIELPGLDESACAQYFDQIARIAAGLDQRIVSIPPFIRQAIFWSLCDPGKSGEYYIRPILLSLAVSYLALINGLPETLLKPLDEIKGLTEEQRRKIEQDLNTWLVTTIKENHAPADQILEALAYARKGADVDFLACITKLSGDDVNAQLLSVFSQLTFIKKRFVYRGLHQRETLYFLHDEMYDILQKHIIDPQKKTPRHRKIFELIHEEYKRRVNLIRDDLLEQFQGGTDTILEQSAAIQELRRQLADLFVDDLHYQLRCDPWQGFFAFYSYAEEALISSNQEAALQLQQELFSTLSQMRAYAERQINRDLVKQIDQLKFDFVNPDTALRWLKGEITKQKNWETVFQTIQRIETQGAERLLHRGEWKAELQTWKCLAYLYQGELESAAQFFHPAHLSALETQARNSQERRLWKAVIARAYHVLGYQERVQGNYIEASKHYHLAMPFWHDQAMQLCEADTENNRAFTQALQGKFAHARQNARDALVLRKRSGQMKTMVYSLTTLAQVEIFAGNYHEAEAHAQEALTFSRGADFKRGEGLALLALAAIRRMRTEPEQQESPTQVKELLLHSLDDGQEAYHIFSVQIIEPERSIKAQAEIGATARELARIKTFTPNQIAEFQSIAVEQLTQAQNSSFERKLWGLYLDAGITLAWHYYYQGESDHVRNLISELNHQIKTYLPAYEVNRNQSPSPKVQTILAVYSQLARLHILQGVQSLEDFEKQPKNRNAVSDSSIQHFILAFEYNGMVEKDFFENRRATNLIKRHVVKLNTEEIKQVFEIVRCAPGDIVPSGTAYDDLVFWQFLEETFGPYDSYLQF